MKEIPHDHCSLKDTKRQTLTDKTEFSASIPGRRIMPVTEGMANYGPQTKSGLLCFVNKVIWDHGHTPSFTYQLRPFYAVKVELS